jgi:hypothetical protein
LLVVLVRGAVAAAARWVAVGIAVVIVPIGAIVAWVGLEEEAGRGDDALG